MLSIECAGGNLLPYQGYIAAEFCLKNMEDTYLGIFLIISDSPYHENVPLLIGTNILSSMIDTIREKHGDRFLQTTDLKTAWYSSFRCLLLREKELFKNNYKLAIVKSAEHRNIIVPSNSTITLSGYLDKELPYAKTSAMTHPTDNSTLTPDLDITPSLIDYNYKQNKPIKVEVSNVTTRTINIPPHAILCEIQPVTIQQNKTKDKDDFSTPLLEQVKIDTDNLTSDELQKGKDLITEYADIFSKDDSDIGHTTLVQHRIELEDEHPFKQRYRRIPPSMYEEVKSHLQQLLRNGIIRKSHSPWSSNIVLVRKKDNSLRICTDFRELNLRTKKDSYAIPRVDEMLDCLAGNRYFSVVDMKSGYFQTDIYEPHKERTAFTVGPLGFFEYNRMPFGLSNAPATYQRLMQDCLGDLHLKICCIFIDDIIIFSRTYEEHLERLRLVFDRIKEANLKLSPGKCTFFKPKVRYVGHIVSEQGIETDPEKIEKIVNWPTPTSPEQVRQFIGFAGYYRRFIKNFSQISQPLTELMPTPQKKNKKKSKEQKPWHWGEKQESAFNRLKELLSSTPILAYADYTKPFELHIDASGIGLGAVLYQNQDGKNRVIAYASRGLTKSEKNYPAHKLEFLSLKWSVCDKFHDYLYGNKFRVLTDNNPLTYVLTSANLDATGHRWLATLSAYDFDILYRPGKNNADADGLSRLPSSTISRESVKAICNSLRTPLVESLSISPDVITNTGIDMAHQIYQDLDWKNLQQQDPEIKQTYDFVRLGQKPKKGQIPSILLLRQFDNLNIQHGILYRKVSMPDGTVTNQLVLPPAYIQTVLEALHNEMGHPGRDRTSSLIRERFYWPGMNKSIDDWIEHCGRCVKRKKEPAKAPLVSITTSQPLELVCIDFLTLEKSKGGQQHILVVTDHFTRYAQAYPTKNQTAKTTADVLFNNFVVHYGIPKRLHSDQGANFEGHIIKELCSLMGTKKSRTTPYHAMGNGMTERFNRTLLSMLGTLEPNKKANWKQHVGPLVHAYNCTRHESTGQSPYFLMFGRQPNLPIDLAFGLTSDSEKVSQTKYVENLRQRLMDAYKLASEASHRAQSKQKEGYDLKARGAAIETGDRVLVKQVAFDGKHKIQDKWEDDTYIVINQPNLDIPVFTVKKENGEGKPRTLHRNLLLPIGYIHEPVQNATQRPKPKPRVKTRQVTKSKPDTDQETSAEDSSFEEEYYFVRPKESVVSAPSSAEYVSDSEGQDSENLIEEDIESVGDAQSDTEIRDDSVETVDRSASESDEEEDFVEVQDTLRDNVENVENEMPQRPATPPNIRPPVPPRRSTRTKVEPYWKRSGDFVTKSAVTREIGITTENAPVSKQSWQLRAEFMMNLIDQGYFKGSEKEASQTLMDIIKTV